MRAKYLERPLTAAFLIIFTTLFYHHYYDNRPFSSTLLQSYALSQSIQLVGPVIMGWSAYIAVCQHRHPNLDLLVTSARGLSSVRLQTVLRAWLLSAFAFVVAAAVAISLDLADETYRNGISPRIAAPILVMPALIAVGYGIGSRVRSRVVPALVAIGGYFLTTEPHYHQSKWTSLALVQQWQFSAWFTEDLKSGLIFSCWVSALSLLCIGVLAVGRLRVVLVGVACAVAAVSAGSLAQGSWNPEQELRVDAATDLICVDGGSVCLHPAFKRALGPIQTHLVGVQKRLEVLHFAPIALEQTPFAFDTPRAPNSVPVSIFSTAEDDLAVSIQEGLVYQMFEACSEARDHPALVEATAQWIAGTGFGPGRRALATGIDQTADGAHMDDVFEVAGVLGCL